MEFLSKFDLRTVVPQTFGSTTSHTETAESNCESGDDDADYDIKIESDSNHQKSPTSRRSTGSLKPSLADMLSKKHESENHIMFPVVEYLRDQKLKEIFKYKLTLCYILAINGLIWVGALELFYGYSFSSSQDKFESSPPAGCLFLVPTFTFLLSWGILKLWWFNRKQWKFSLLSPLQEYTINVVETTFLTGAFYSFWTFLMIITLFRIKNVVNPNFSPGSMEWACWKAMWKTSLRASDIVNPPHRTLDDLYSGLNDCDIASIQNKSILSHTLDEILLVSATNYMICLIAGNLLAHWGLRTIAFVLTTLRQPLEDYDLRNLILRVHASLTMVPRRERQPVSQLFVWIEESVRHAVYEKLYKSENLPIDATKPLPYLPIFTKKSPYIAGLMIGFAFSGITQFIGQNPGQNAVAFVIEYGVPLYGGPFWSTISSGGIWMIIASTIGMLLLPGLEWALLISCVYQPAKNFQRSNAIRMNLIQAIIDPDVHVKAFNAYNMRVLVYIRHWVLTSSLHSWYILRSFLVNTVMLRDHKQSELGVLGLLFIAIFLISEVLFTYFLYGFLGNGAFGPWAVVSCPVLVFLVVDVLTHTLGTYTSMKNQSNILRMISKQRLVSAQNEENTMGIEQFLNDLWVEELAEEDDTFSYWIKQSTGDGDTTPTSSGHKNAVKFLVCLHILRYIYDIFTILTLNSNIKFQYLKLHRRNIISCSTTMPKRQFG